MTEQELKWAKMACVFTGFFALLSLALVFYSYNRFQDTTEEWWRLLWFAAGFVNAISFYRNFTHFFRFCKGVQNLDITAFKRPKA